LSGEICASGRARLLCCQSAGDCVRHTVCRRLSGLRLGRVVLCVCQLCARLSLARTQKRPAALHTVCGQFSAGNSATRRTANYGLRSRPLAARLHSAFSHSAFFLYPTQTRTPLRLHFSVTGGRGARAQDDAAAKRGPTRPRKEAQREPRQRATRRPTACQRPH